VKVNHAAILGAAKCCQAMTIIEDVPSRHVVGAGIASVGAGAQYVEVCCWINLLDLPVLCPTP